MKFDKKKIVIGMTGRMDSVVAAYLLMSQGHDVIGVGVVLVNEEDYQKYSEDEIFTRCHIEDLKETKIICDKLGIPFYGADCRSAYRALVRDFVIASRLDGTTNFPCAPCNRLKIQTLLDKAKILKADLVATGHYVVLQWNTVTDEYILSASADTLHDQSYELTGLTQEQLKYLNFPLSGMRRKDVKKIAESVGLEYCQSRDHKKYCFMNNPHLHKLIEEHVAESFYERGDIVNIEGQALQEHPGIHYYYIGQKKIKDAEGNTLPEKNLEVVRIEVMEKKIMLDYVNNYSFQHCYLMNFKCNVTVDMSRPLRGYAQIDYEGGTTKRSCVLYFKNNNTALIEFDQSITGLLVDDSWVVFYSSKEKGKVIGGGYVWGSGNFSIRKYKFVAGKEGEDWLEPSGSKQEEETKAKKS